jgi:hypothetical protein
LPGQHRFADAAKPGNGLRDRGGAGGRAARRV